MSENNANKPVLRGRAGPRAATGPPADQLPRPTDSIEIESSANSDKIPPDIASDSDRESLTQHQNRKPTLPEDRAMRLARRAYAEILTRVPPTSETIKTTERKEVREWTTKLHENMILLVGIMKELRYEIASRDEIIKDLQKVSEPTALSMTQPAISYADKLKNNMTPAVPSKKTFPVQVRATETASAGETRTILKTVVNPNTSRIPVEKIRQIKNGALIVECANQEAADRLKVSISQNAKGKLTATNLTKLKPRMTLRIENEIPRDELLETIRENNEWLGEGADDAELKKHIVEKYRFGGRGRGPTTVVFEVDPETRKKLLNRPIYIDWQRAVFEDFVDLAQCFRCHEYGHKTGTCKVIREQEICGKCSLRGHSFKECESAELCCVLCKRHNTNNRRGIPYETDHHTRSDSCAVKTRLIQSAQQKIDYGQ